MSIVPESVPLGPQVESFRELLEELPLAAVSLDGAGKVVSANRNARLLLETAGAQLLRETMERLAADVTETGHCVQASVSLGGMGEVQLWASESGWGNGHVVLMERNLAARNRSEANLLKALLKASSEVNPGGLELKALEALRAALAGVHLVFYKKEGGALVPVAHTGLQREHVALVGALAQDPRANMVAAACSGERPTSVNPVSKSALKPLFPYAEPERLCAVAFPVRDEGKVAGALYVCGQAALFGEAEFRLALGLVDALGLLVSQRRQRQEVAEGRRTLAALLANLPDAVLELDAAGCVQFVGGNATSVFQGDTQLLLGGALSLKLPAEERVRFDSFCKAPGATVEHFNLSLPGGGLKAISVSAHRESAEGVVRLLVRDHTQRRALEREVEQARDVAAQQEKLASIGQLVAGLAHEINTPLSYLRGNLHALKNEVRSEAFSTVPAELLKEASETISDCDLGVTRIHEIVQALLGTARKGRDSVPFDPSGPVRDAVTILKGASRAQLAVEVELPALPKVLGAPGSLSQVVLNLMKNGLDAMGGKGKLVVRGVEVEAAVLISVRDFGPGIPPAAQARLYEPFFTTKEVGKGTGMGLYLCHQLVRGLGGSLAFETGSDGTTFTVRLPTTLSE